LDTSGLVFLVASERKAKGIGMGQGTSFIAGHQKMLKAPISMPIV